MSRAIEFHRKGEHEKALELYNKAIEEKEPACSAFLNASAILEVTRSRIRLLNA